MCADGRPDDSTFGIRFATGTCSDAYLARSGPARGSAFVVWRGRHVAEPTELAADEATTFWLEVLDAARAIEARFTPAKLNYQILGNAVPHLHVHLVPRYVDDDAPGRPLPSHLYDEPAWLATDDDMEQDVAGLKRAMSDPT
jgi:diadenosine tetraphosphate (Ap4A) HIT family hydrolase